MNELLNTKVGNKVFCTGDSGFCDDSIEKVIKITIKYDENTGEKYNVIHVPGDRKFDSRSGAALSPPYAYYILYYKKTKL